MSVAETAVEVHDKGIGRPSKELTAEYMCDAKEMQRLMNATQHLTDDAYEELVHDYGFRLALLVLRAKAVSGDVKAIDLYLRVVKESRAARRHSRDPKAEHPENEAFVRRPRSSD